MLLSNQIKNKKKYIGIYKGVNGRGDKKIKKNLRHIVIPTQK